MHPMIPLVALLVPLLSRQPAHAAHGTAVTVAGGRVCVSFVDEPMAAAIERLATGLGAQVEWLGTPDRTNVSTDLRDVAVDEALDRVLRTHSYFVVAAKRTGAVRRIVVLGGTSAAGEDAAVPEPASALSRSSRASLDDTDLDPSIKARLLDPDPTVRRSVLDYLRVLAPDDPHRDVVLSRLVADPDRLVRDEALPLLAGVRSARPRH